MYIFMYAGPLLVAPPSPGHFRGGPAHPGPSVSSLAKKLCTCAKIMYFIRKTTYSNRKFDTRKHNKSLV